MLGKLQKIGKALMLPIAVLPAAGLLNRLGAEDVLNVPFIHAGGAALFDFLALLFAIGISIGLSRDSSGAAGLNGAIVFFILNFGVIGVNPDINMGVFAGFIAGLTAPILYNFFYDKKIFGNQEIFDGKHIAIIINALLALILVAVFGVAWPAIQDGLNTINSFITNAGAFGSAVFGVLNRALIPTGLHHVLNSYLWFGFGSFVEGHQIIHGDINRFFAGDTTAGTFQVGFFPIMMFGLPGAAFAMYLAAKKKNRKEVGGMMLSLAITAFLTGITEPIEFTFMFIAPFLYGVHAILTGLSMYITNLLGIKLGFTFSAGFIDFALNFTKGHNAWQLIPIGLIFTVIYFFLFYFIIKKFNLKTPGREEETNREAALDSANAPVQTAVSSLGSTEADFPTAGKVDKYEQMAQGFIGGLGGTDNIIKVDNCTTRLRLQVNDAGLLNEPALKNAGARGVVKLDKRSVQLIVGPAVEFVADKMHDLTGK